MKNNRNKVLIILGILVVLLFSGCSAPGAGYPIYSEYEFTSQGQIVYHESLSELAFTDDPLVWQILQAIDPQQFQTEIDEQLKYEIAGYDRSNIKIYNDRFYIGFYTDYSENILVSDIFTLDQDVYSKYVEPAVVIKTGDINHKNVSEIEEVADYSVVFMESGFSPLENASIDNVDIGLDSLIPQFNEELMDFTQEHIRIPGKVYYLSDNFEIVSYNIITGETLLRGSTLDDDTCILFKYGMPKTVRLLIAGVIALLLIIILITLFSKLTGVSMGNSGKGGVVVGIRGKYKDANFKIKKNETIVLGRDPMSCNVVFSEDDEKISRKHCTIQYNYSNNTYIVQDYSKNGVFNHSGDKIENGKNNILPRGSVIYLGNRDNMFRLN